MAQTGYTPILIYSSSTTTNAPAAGNLTNSTLGSELAINITDGKLFYKDNANAIQVIGWKTTPTTAGGTGLTSYTAGDLLYYATGTTLSKLAIGTAYYMLGVNAGATAPSWQPSATSVLTTQGDLLYASAANTLARLAKSATATRYLSNTGASNNPAWSQIDMTNGVTGTLPTGNGGTGQSSFTAGDLLYYASGTALSKLGIGAANTVLTSSGSAPQWSTSLTLASTLTASALIPSGSSVPTNGIYYPAANQVGFSTNSTYRGMINASGQWLVYLDNASAVGNNKLIVGYPGVSQDGIRINGYADNEMLRLNSQYNQSATGAGVTFYRGTPGSETLQGSITWTSSGTGFNTTSDYRLKENVQPMVGALERIQQLRPVTYTWKDGGENGEGFIAHELQAIFPMAVTGEKDQVDKDGKPLFQGIDTSFLVGALTAAIQELKAKFDAYVAAHP